jgi:hypothetical protein
MITYNSKKRNLVKERMGKWANHEWRKLEVGGGKVVDDKE